MRDRAALMPLSVSVSCLLALAASPAHADPFSPELDPASQVFSVTVTENNKLADAITQASKALEQPEFRSAEIKLVGCTTQELPQQVAAKGPITIIGDKDRSFGPGTNFEEPCAVLKEGAFSSPTFESPVTLRGLNLKLDAAGVRTNSDLSIINCVASVPELNRNILNFYRHNVVADGSNISSNRKIRIEHSRFLNTSLIQSDSENSNILIKDNDIYFRGESYFSTVSINSGRDTGAVAIEGNRFQIQTTGGPNFSRDGKDPVIGFTHGNIAIHNNHFSAPALSDTTYAIGIRDLKRSVKRVNITQNTVIGLHAAGNIGEYPEDGKRITINNNDFSRSQGAFVKPQKFEFDFGFGFASVHPEDMVDMTKNYWGGVDRSKIVADTSSPLESYSPIYGPLESFPDQIGALAPLPVSQSNQQKPPADRTGLPANTKRLSGPSRFETAVQIAQTTYPQQAKAVVLARADIFADSVTAVPFADALEAPILLSPSNQLHPATAAEIQRVLAPGSTVYVMGGEAALSQDVVMAVARLGMRVERIAGPHRAATAVEVAKRLQGVGKAKEVLLVDGGAWEPGLVAGPAAAEADGVVLMTLSGQVTPETQSFLNANSSMTVTGIGHKPTGFNRVSNVLSGDSPEALSTAVAKEYFVKPHTVGLATTADFADALAGGPHMAKLHEPILLTSESRQLQTREYIKSLGGIATAFVYGGPARLSDQFTTQLITP